MTDFTAPIVIFGAGFALGYIWHWSSSKACYERAKLRKLQQDMDLNAVELRRHYNEGW